MNYVGFYQNCKKILNSHLNDPAHFLLEHHEPWFHFLFSRYNLSQHVYYANFQSQKVIKNVLPTKIALLD